MSLTGTFLFQLMKFLDERRFGILFQNFALRKRSFLSSFNGGTKKIERKKRENREKEERKIERRKKNRKKRERKRKKKTEKYSK